MKNLIFLSLFVSTISIAKDATVYSSFKGDINHSMKEFYITSFTQSFTYCYIGNVESVCHEVSIGADQQMKKYQDGAHDYFTIDDCKNNHGEITVIAKLFDDYETEAQTITVTIPVCYSTRS